MDYDGRFTTNDASIFNSFYNEALASVPEPGGLGVLSLAALAVVRRRRRRIETRLAFPRRPRCPLSRRRFVFGIVGFADGARAKTLYWDVNGPTPAQPTARRPAGNGRLFAPASWSADASGSSPTTRFVDGSAVVFSAGGDGTGPSVINVRNPARTTGFTNQEAISPSPAPCRKSTTERVRR